MFWNQNCLKPINDVQGVLYFFVLLLHLGILLACRFLIYASCTDIADVSLAGRQVIEVSPASVGGSLFCLAVCVRGTDVQKVNYVSL